MSDIFKDVNEILRGSCELEMDHVFNSCLSFPSAPKFDLELRGTTPKVQLEASFERGYFWAV